MATTRVDFAAGIDVELGADLATTALALARRFAAGATMWCVAPSAPEHARHVAVEFVHPVVVGKRALPAVCIDGPDIVAALRSVVRPDDVVLAVGDTAAGSISSALRRAPAWGAVSVWLGWGPRPAAGAADHVLWTGDERGAARHNGDVVLLYHVLWELTHVCFEHPGLLAADGDRCGDDTTCITCGDEGRLGEVAVAGDRDVALVRTARGTETVDTMLVGAVQPGDLVLVHAGAAITVVEAAPR